MPRFFFDVSDGRCAADLDGAHFVDDRAARREALRRAAILLRITQARPGATRHWRISVKNELGVTLFWIDSSRGVSLSSP